MRRMARLWAVGSLVAVLTLAASPAQAVGQNHVTVRAEPASVRVDQVLVVSGTGTPRRSLEIERLVDHRWRPLATAHVTKAGRYSVNLRVPKAPTTWQLKVGTKRLTVRVVKSAYAITAITAPVLSSAGRIAISGSVSPHATGVVWLQRKVGGVWHDLGTAQLTKASTYLVHTAGTAGTYTLRVRKSAGDHVAAGFSPAKTVAVATPLKGFDVTTTSLPAATVDAPYSASLTATGGTAPYTWSVSSGALPVGLSLTPQGILAGRPTAAGSSTFAVTVLDSGNHVAQGSLTLVATVSPAAGNVVRAWGANASGQLGNGTTSADTPSATPTLVPGVTGAVAVTAGDDDGYALRFDGTVMVWGDGSYGQLGNGTTGSSTTPVTVPGLQGVVAITASAETALALKNDGTVWAWGSGDEGELGSGGTDDSDVPRQVPGLQGVTAIAAAASTGYALLADGTVMAWGDNEDGEVGDGTTNVDLSPVPVTGLTQVTAIAAGTGNGYALRSDGTVWSWGSNTYGDLGDGDDLGNDSSVPVQVAGVTGATAVAGGYASGYAVAAGGVVMAWGANGSGQLGNDDTGIFTVHPAPMTGVSGVTGVASDGLTTLGVAGNGTVLVTGDNGQGQLGNGDLTVTGVLTMQPVPGLQALSIAAGLQDDFAITAG